VDRPLCTDTGHRRGAYRVLVGKPEGKRPLGRPKHRWENIKIDIETSWTEFIWFKIALVGAVMNSQVPGNAGNFLTSCRTVVLSRRSRSTVS
jgi:hypothetical protein